jgi:hypothetical protein
MMGALGNGCAPFFFLSPPRVFLGAALAADLGILAVVEVLVLVALVFVAALLAAALAIV